MPKPKKLRVPAFISSAWSRVSEPRSITALHCLVYVLIAIAGASALIDPPNTLSSSWGGAFSTLWAASLLLGGSVAACAAYFGRWWLEKIALLLVCTGVVLYASIVTTIHFYTSSNKSVHALFLVVVVLHLAVRYLRIHRFSYEPGR